MKHSVVDSLNRWIGEETGLLINGKPRFCWLWAPDMVYWRGRLGRVWVMSFWGFPKWSEQEWAAQFGDRVAYPKNGMYHAYPETQLSPGSVPTHSLTANYIWAFKKQMSMSYEHQVVDVHNEVNDWHTNHTNQFRQMVQDEAPAFGNFKTESGDKPHFVVGGVDAATAAPAS